MNKTYCFSCLKSGYESFCPKCLKLLFDGKKISHILNFSRPDFNKAKIEQSSRLSISGVQIKHSLKLENKQLNLTESGGKYIIKPIPYGVYNNMEAVPANEHLTMQIANQVFNITTAFNALVKFSDGDYVYLTKRFDLVDDEDKFLVEDFAQIAGKTSETDGDNYKYNFSYEGIANLINKYVSAYPVEIEKFFKLVLFNYLISNGDAHLKNFSLYRNSLYGDYLLTPAYDLLCTRIHTPNESDLALDLFADNYQSEQYKFGSKYTRPDFVELGNRIGIKEKRIDLIINNMIDKKDKMCELVNRSFLSENIKSLYLSFVEERLNRLSR
ncbi:MAG: HipA domain-containing protein [bacterium]